jgi:Ligated ion channel L-glutamate- and glycine-binding site
MKLLLIFCVIAFFDITKSFEVESKNYSELASAVLIAIDGINTQSNFTANFLTSNLTENFQSKDFIDELLAKTFDDTKTVVCHYESDLKFNKNSILQRQLTIVIIENFDEFLDVYHEKVQVSLRFNGIFLIVLTNGEIVEVHEMFKLFWKLQIFNVNLMFGDENGEVLVKTFKPFNAQNCHDTTPILVNKFKDGKFLNATKNFFPKKMNNLHNCPVNVAVAVNSDPFVIVKQTKNESYHVEGEDVQFLNTLSAILNFKINLTFIGSSGFLLEDGSSEGVFKALINGKSDLTIGGWWLKKIRLKLLDASTSYLSESIIFVVPSGQALTALERLVYPFTLLVWMLVILYFLFGVVVIFIMNRRSKVVQDFVFGTDVKTPYLNLFIAFIGGAQKKLPGRNFARFLLMMFLMYSLVVRTIYQASFYELLRSNKRHNTVQSIDEMIEKDFKFYTDKSSLDVYQGSQGMKQRLV